jgi:hypothetical protein
VQKTSETLVFGPIFYLLRMAMELHGGMQGQVAGVAAAPVPGKNRVRRDETRRLCQGFLAQLLAERGERFPLAIAEPHAALESLEPVENGRSHII